MRRSLLFLLLPLLLTPGCTPAAVGDSEVIPFDVTLSLADAIPTVVRVDWDVDLDGMTAAWVAFGPDEELEHQVSVDLQDEGPYETLLVGSKGETEVHVRVFAETDDGSYVSEESLITTGPVPAALPNLEVTDAGEGHWSGFLVSGFVADETSFILDEDGDYVWWHHAQGSGSGGPDTGGVVLGRTRLSRDGRSLLYSYNNVEGVQENSLHRVSLDGSEDDAVPMPWAHHDFTELPDGTVAYFAYDPRFVEGAGEQAGDSIVELAPDGSTREVWNVWDWYEYSETGGGATGPGTSWPHCNAIDYVASEDAYLIGSLTLGAIILVDRESGEPVWTLGGTEPDLASLGVDLEFHHQFQLLGDHLLYFDNEGQGMGNSSQAVELALYTDNGWAEEVWSYDPSASLNSPNLGDVERLDDGDTLVTFSISGQIHEVSPDGEVVWKIAAAAGGAMSYVQRVEAIDALR